MTYYEKWSSALAEILLERGALSRQEVNAATGTTVADSTDIRQAAQLSSLACMTMCAHHDSASGMCRFKAGDVVRVKSETGA